MKSVSFLSPHLKDETGENSFVILAFSDIVTGCLDETDTTFIPFVQCRMC